MGGLPITFKITGNALGTPITEVPVAFNRIGETLYIHTTYDPNSSKGGVKIQNTRVCNAETVPLCALTLASQHFVLQGLRSKVTLKLDDNNVQEVPNGHSVDLLKPEAWQIISGMTCLNIPLPSLSDLSLASPPLQETAPASMVPPKIELKAPSVKPETQNEILRKKLLEAVKDKNSPSGFLSGFASLDKNGKITHVSLNEDTSGKKTPSWSINVPILVTSKGVLFAYREPVVGSWNPDIQNTISQFLLSSANQKGLQEKFGSAYEKLQKGGSLTSETFDMLYMVGDEICRRALETKTRIDNSLQFTLIQESVEAPYKLRWTTNKREDSKGMIRCYYDKETFHFRGITDSNTPPQVAAVLDFYMAIYPIQKKNEPKKIEPRKELQPVQTVLPKLEETKVSTDAPTRINLQEEVKRSSWDNLPLINFPDEKGSIIAHGIIGTEFFPQGFKLEQLKETVQEIFSECGIKLDQRNQKIMQYSFKLFEFITTHDGNKLKFFIKKIEYKNKEWIELDKEKEVTQILIGAFMGLPEVKIVIRLEELDADPFKALRIEIRCKDKTKMIIPTPVGNYKKP